MQHKNVYLRPLHFRIKERLAGSPLNVSLVPNGGPVSLKGPLQLPFHSIDHLSCPYRSILALKLSVTSSYYPWVTATVDTGPPSAPDSLLLVLLPSRICPPFLGMTTCFCDTKIRVGNWRQNSISFTFHVSFLRSQLNTGSHG